MEQDFSLFLGSMSSTRSLWRIQLSVGRRLSAPSVPPTAPTTKEDPAHKCTDCGHEMAVTPIIKSGIVAHFTGLLKVDKVRSAVGKRNKFKVRLEGEAITSDDFIEVMEADQAEKARKAAEDKK